MEVEYGINAATSKANLPHDSRTPARHIRRMETIDILIERVTERLQELDLSERAASLAATETPDALRYIRTRRAMPGPMRLYAIARVLKATPEWLLGETDFNEYISDDLAPYVEAARETSRRMKEAREQLNVEVQRDIRVPIYSATRLPDTNFGLWPSMNLKSDDYWHDPDFDKRRVTVQQIKIDRSQLTGHFQSPLSTLEAASSFGIYLPVSVLDPALGSGSSVLVSTSRPVQIRDIGLFYLSDGSGGGDLNQAPIIPARLRDIRSDYFELEQFGGSYFALPAQQVLVVFRIYTLSDFLRQV